MTRRLKKLSTHILAIPIPSHHDHNHGSKQQGSKNSSLMIAFEAKPDTYSQWDESCCAAAPGLDQSGSESPLYFLNSPLVTCSALAGPRPPLYSLIYATHRQLGANLTCLSTTDLLRFALVTFRYFPSTILI